MLKYWTNSDPPTEEPENPEVKLKYPRAMPFILINEFCERFNYYGMKTVLVLYLTMKLKYDDDTSTVLYHTFMFLNYFTCIFGALLADSWLGKFKTIFYLSIVYALGSVLIAVGAIEPLGLPMSTFTIVGLFLIAVGSGGIKPCVSAFGAEQFTLPQQAKQLAQFFSLFYFFINAGSLISTGLTPFLREDVKCFDMDDCFPLAFGVPAILMVFALVVFLCGSFLYKKIKNHDNMLVKVTQCITTASKTPQSEKNLNPRDHWLDYAEQKHGKKLVAETKILLNVLILYLPLPFFWALYDQQGSRWTLQATRMDGDLGFYTIKPDQMQFVNPLLVLMLIPLFDYVIYPVLHRVGINTPLRKMALGGILASFSFVISAFVEISLDQGKISILWQLPQIITVTVAEVLFSITGLQFSFTQAPESLKSVIQSFWLLTTAFGNVIVIIIAGVKSDETTATFEFFLFAGLMFVDIVIFICLANRYQPISVDDLKELEEKKL